MTMTTEVFILSPQSSPLPNPEPPTPPHNSKHEGTDFTQHPDRWLAPGFTNRRPPLSNECLAALRDAVAAKGKPLTDAERKEIISRF